MAESLRFTGVPDGALPGDAIDFINRTLAATYDLPRLTPVPDLGQGYERLITQLELLDTFGQPAPPALPAPQFITKMFSDPAHPPQSPTTPETATPPYAHGPGVVPTTYSGGPGFGYGQKPPPTATDSTADSESACGSFCLAVLAFLAFSRPAGRTLLGRMGRRKVLHLLGEACCGELEERVHHRSQPGGEGCAGRTEPAPHGEQFRRHGGSSTNR